MAYTTINKPSDYFSTTIYTGTATQQSVNTGIDMANNGSMLWVKDRDGANNHNLFDTFMGIDYLIFPSANDGKFASTRLVSFDSTGYTALSTAGVNQNGNRHVAWNWLAGSSQAGSSNTDGSITSTVSANTTSGFSMVSYTGTGSNATIGHGLGAVPSLIFVKKLSATSDWITYSKEVGNTKNIRLNTSEAVDTSSAVWNATTPTSSVFSVGTFVDTNGSGATFVAYCFAEKKGYSKFGSYTGNGNANGPFVYTGFKPAFILIRSVSTTNWNMFDSKRSAYNVADETLWSNTTGTEATIGTTYGIDILSNGFKPRTVSSQVNNNNTQMIYMAFAEQPLVGTNGVPATAR